MTSDRNTKSACVDDACAFLYLVRNVLKWCYVEMVRYVEINYVANLNIST